MNKVSGSVEADPSTEFPALFKESLFYLGGAGHLFGDVMQRVERGEMSGEGLGEIRAAGSSELTCTHRPAFAPARGSALPDAGVKLVVLSKRKLRQRQLPHTLRCSPCVREDVNCSIL